MFVPLSGRFDEALGWAAALHRGQCRKGTTIPYVSHLLAVAAIVLEHGGDENQAIAALLHDAVEDAKTTPGEIERRFGPDVVATVLACSDSTEQPKRPWRERKEGHLAHLREVTTTERVLLVAAADKLHNARSVLADLRAHGPTVWDKFNPEAGGAAGQLWYYGELTALFGERLPGLLADELAHVVGRLRTAVGDAAGAGG